MQNAYRSAVQTGSDFEPKRRENNIDPVPTLADLKAMLVDHMNNMLHDPQPVDVDYGEHLLERICASERQTGMKQAKSRVLRRTEIPKDAKNPTRDIVVITGEECARIIQQDIDELQTLIEETSK